MFHSVSGISVNPQYKKSPVAFGDFSVNELENRLQGTERVVITPDEDNKNHKGKVEVTNQFQRDGILYVYGYSHLLSRDVSLELEVVNGTAKGYSFFYNPGTPGEFNPQAPIGWQEVLDAPVPDKPYKRGDSRTGRFFRKDPNWRDGEH